MIRLQRSLLHGLDHEQPSPATVRAALQQAIELEHSTIPLYLYALYSLDASKNRAIHQILKSVVVEEMLHMILASNVLNAIGGRPSISKPNFIPTYPGRLPGGVERQLFLQLRPFSMEQLALFIEIEEPREALTGDALARGGAGDTCTIGEFYTGIEAAIERLPDDTFAQSSRHQVGPDLMFGSITVVDKRSASEAITTIIEQGEGTTTSPEEIDGPDGRNDYAHFYRLSQIHRGRHLVEMPDALALTSRFDYAGDSIDFDPGGVYAIPSNPTANDYALGSPERRLIDQFNFTYSSLLGRLHDLVNGRANLTTFMSSLELMHSLEDQAKSMVDGGGGRRAPVGPTFEFRPLPDE